MEQEKIILSRVMTPRGELQLQQRLGSDEQSKPVYEIIYNGVFAVWAAQKCAAFQQRLEDIFGRTELITVQEIGRENRSTDYFIYRAR